MSMNLDFPVNGNCLKIKTIVNQEPTFIFVWIEQLKTHGMGRANQIRGRLCENCKIYFLLHLNLCPSKDNLALSFIKKFTEGMSSIILKFLKGLSYVSIDF